MQSLPACGLVDLKGKLMVFSIYAVSYERYSAALYGAVRAAPIKMSVTFFRSLLFGEDKGERERDRPSFVP